MKSHTERVYVKVTSETDATGYMQPKAITWSDGRVFQIETVKDFRPAGTQHNSSTTDCYTVVIKGDTKYLFFELCQEVKQQLLLLSQIQKHMKSTQLTIHI